MKISIITPIYHGKKYIKHIQSMIEANVDRLGDGCTIEFVIVNDSPDEPIMPEDVKEARTYEVIQVTYPENLGIQGARIEGIKKASGDYIMMLDQDDVISDNYLESQRKHMKKNTDVLVANGLSQLVDGDKILYRYAPMQWTVKYLWFYAKFDSRIISPGQCLIKKEVIPQIWLDNPLKNNGADDYLLWILLLSQGIRFDINRDIIYTHTWSGQNASADVDLMRKSVEEAIKLAEPMVKDKYIQIIKNRMRKERKTSLVRMVERLNRE